MIRLQDQEPFAHGGNRLCYVDPTDPHRCIKVRRPEFTLEDLRRRKGFPHTLFPAAWLDESSKEDAILRACDERLGERVHRVLSRNYGFVETDLGRGLCSELIRDADGRISLSVMQYIWEMGYTDSLAQAVDRFEADWVPLMIPARDILLHNVVAQRGMDGNVERVVVIDGLGFSGLIPFRLQPARYRMSRARRKLSKFRGLIDELLVARESGHIENPFWKQKHDGLDSLGNKTN